jgi:hypothetical protein
MFGHLKPDVDSLVNFGPLASQLKRPDEAISARQRALTSDSSQANAHLYLADALAKKKTVQGRDPSVQQYSLH